MSSSPQEERITNAFNINVRRVKSINDHVWGLLRYGRQDTIESVTPRKEESEFREEMWVEKKEFAVFLF